MSALDEEEREDLLDRLAVLVRPDPGLFVSSPFVEPTPRFFPDVFDHDAASAQALAQRLLGYAGLDGFRAEVVLEESARSAAPSLTTSDLVSVEGQTIHFACSELGRVDDATLCLAHEVSRAALLVHTHRRSDSVYRASVRPEAAIVTPDASDEALVAASIFAYVLGFGVLATLGAHHARQGGHSRGGVSQTSWQHVAYGRLSPEAASFLLAAQLVVRAVPSPRRNALLASLPTNRRVEVETALASVEREALLARLGLPEPSRWPPERMPTIGPSRSR